MYILRTTMLSKGLHIAEKCDPFLFLRCASTKNKVTHVAVAWDSFLTGMTGFLVMTLTNAKRTKASVDTVTAKTFLDLTCANVTKDSLNSMLEATR